MRLLPYGDRALLAEVDPAQVLPLCAAARDLPGVVATAPAARTALIRYAPGTDVTVLRAALQVLPLTSPEAIVKDEIVLPVVYDGADLADVAGLAGVSRDDVVRLHCGARYSVAFCGFAPGFAYLTGLDTALRVPRLDAPRTAVPAGAVAIAGEYSAVYPRRSPGGWRLLGRCDAVLWDTVRAEPALLTPGTPVRFEPA